MSSPSTPVGGIPQDDDVVLWAEVVFPVVSLAVFLAYQFRYLMVDAKDDTARYRTARGLMRDVRLAWIQQQHMKGAVPVNTLRDAFRVSVFLGSAALLIAFTVARVVLENYTRCFPSALGTSQQAGLASCSGQARLFLVKACVLVASLVGGFLQFTLHLRFLHHTSLLMNTKAIGNVVVEPRHINLYFRRAQRHYSYGLRHLYFASPLLLWFLSPYLMAASTVALVFVLRQVDYFKIDLKPDTPVVDAVAAAAAGATPSGTPAPGATPSGTPAPAARGAATAVAPLDAPECQRDATAGGGAAVAV